MSVPYSKLSAAGARVAVLDRLNACVAHLAPRSGMSPEEQALALSSAREELLNALYLLEVGARIIAHRQLAKTAEQSAEDEGAFLDALSALEDMLAATPATTDESGESGENDAS